MDKPQPSHVVNGGIEKTEEGNSEVKAPVQLKIEFLRALRNKDLQLATQLCQTILNYEPDNPEASEFLPLLKNKLQKEQEEEQSSGSKNNSEDDSGSDEESQTSSSSSTSDSTSADGDDEEKG